MSLNVKSKLKSAAKATSRPGVPRAAGGSRFVLFVGDEGAILVHLKRNVVISRQFIPDASPANLNEFRQTIAREMGTPLLMIVDTMDQSYVQQTLPPVSSLSVSKLIKRRLERDFAASDIKGSLLIGREPSGRKDWHFMMISLERNPHLNAWLDFVGDLPNRFLGINLVSTETAAIIRAIDYAVDAAKGEGSPQWKFFISHNKVGGFRQVILRNGKLVFTRLAQPVSESNIEVITGSIEQEILNTIEFMKRMGYNPQAGLDIYVIASGGIRDNIDTSKFIASSLRVITPYELSQYLGIEGATQSTDQFGDVVLAASIGSLRKRQLMLSTPRSLSLDQYYKLLYSQRAIAIIATAAIFGYAVTVAYGIFELNERMKDMEAQKSEAQQKLDTLRSEVAKSKIDVETANDMIDLYKQLMEESLSPLSVIRKIGNVNMSPVAVRELEWSLDDGMAGTKKKGAGSPAPTHAQDGGSADGQAKMQVRLVLEFPDYSYDPALMQSTSNQLMERFRKELSPDYVVEYTTEAVVAPKDDKLDITFGTVKEEDLPKKQHEGQVKEVEMVIRGPVPSAKTVMLK